MKSVEKNLKDMKEKTENKKPKVKPEKQRRRKQKKRKKKPSRIDLPQKFEWKMQTVDSHLLVKIFNSIFSINGKRPN